jgi:hypothetical protein
MKCEKKNEDEAAKVDVRKIKERAMGGCKVEGVDEHGKRLFKKKSILMTAQISVLLVFEVLPDGENILSRSTEITRKDALIRMRE